MAATHSGHQEGKRDRRSRSFRDRGGRADEETRADNGPDAERDERAGTERPLQCFLAGFPGTLEQAIYRFETKQ